MTEREAFEGWALKRLGANWPASLWIGLLRDCWNESGQAAAARYGPVVEALREVVRCYGTNATQDEVAWAMDDAHEALAALDGGGKS